MNKKVWSSNSLNSKDRLAIVSSIILIAVTIVIWAGDFTIMREVTKEDGLVESTTALFFLLTFGWCVYRLIFKPRAQTRIFLILWAVLSFVFLGEETSWFQRVFNISTPEYIQSINEQNELNIHNLSWFKGKYGLAEALKEGDHIFGAIFNSQNLFRMGYFTYFLIIPMLVYSKKFSWIEQKLAYPTPSRAFFASLWTTIFLALVLFVFSSGDTRYILMAETREMTYAAFIFIYCVTHLDQGARRSAGAE